MQESNKPSGQITARSCVLQDAINESVDRGNAGVSVHTIDPLNHKEPCKVIRDKNESPKSRRVPFRTSQTAAELLKDSKYAVPDSVTIQQDTIRRDLVHESLISVAEEFPKEELQIKPSERGTHKL